MKKKLKPIHPGEHLREDFMKPLGLSSSLSDLSVIWASVGWVPGQVCGAAGSGATSLVTQVAAGLE